MYSTNTSATITKSILCAPLGHAQIIHSNLFFIWSPMHFLNPSLICIYTHTMRTINTHSSPTQSLIAIWTIWYKNAWTAILQSKYPCHSPLSFFKTITRTFKPTRSILSVQWSSITSLICCPSTPRTIQKAISAFILWYIQMYLIWFLLLLLLETKTNDILLLNLYSYTLKRGYLSLLLFIHRIPNL